MTDTMLEAESGCRPKFFILADDERTVVPVDHYLDWLHWKTFRIIRTRVANTVLGEHFVSTVFWGISDQGSDKIFETMVFRGNPTIEASYEKELAAWHSATWDEAECQHLRAIGWLQEQLTMAETWNMLV